VQNKISLKPGHKFLDLSPLLCFNNVGKGCVVGKKKDFNILKGKRGRYLSVSTILFEVVVFKCSFLQVHALFQRTHGISVTVCGAIQCYVVVCACDSS